MTKDEFDVIPETHVFSVIPVNDTPKHCLVQIIIIIIIIIIIANFALK